MDAAWVWCLKPHGYLNRMLAFESPTHDQDLRANSAVVCIETLSPTVTFVAPFLRISREFFPRSWRFVYRFLLERHERRSMVEEPAPLSPSRR